MKAEKKTKFDRRQEGRVAGDPGFMPAALRIKKEAVVETASFFM